MKRNVVENKLIQHAFALGINDARLIPAEIISVEDHLAKMCEVPQCDGYGQAINCPPHVMTPDAFRAYIARYARVLVFKFDVPTETLLSDDRHEIARMVHEVAANIEHFAADNGYANSKGLAAGSCKRLFCSQYDQCSALTGGGVCRFPQHARPSMSGLGINFFELARELGWQISKMTKDSPPENVSMGMMAGMVLIG